MIYCPRCCTNKAQKGSESNTITVLVLLKWPQNVRTNIAYFITLLKTSLVQLALKEGGLKILRMRTEPNTEGERDLEADCGDKGTAKGRVGGGGGGGG